jgi:hypothetical protein
MRGTLPSVRASETTGLHAAAAGDKGLGKREVRGRRGEGTVGR